MEVCHHCGCTQHHFLNFFYLAMSQEPDYMPGAQRKAQQQKQQAQNASAASEVVEHSHQHHE
jgi:hypothetical protein